MFCFIPFLPQQHKYGYFFYTKCFEVKYFDKEKVLCIIRVFFDEISF